MITYFYLSRHFSARRAGMTEDEYWASDPNNKPDDLPSSFLSEEDVPEDTNVVFIPNYDLNLPLILENYVEEISRCKTKQGIKEELLRLWHHAVHFGVYSEKMNKLQQDIDEMQFEIALMNGEVEIEYLEDEDI